jgi:endo-1,3-1,4-beta-glycanase ExoK
MNLKSWARTSLRAGLAVALLSSSAWGKDYKSAEFETTKQWGFGAFEARIRCAQGPGVISTFFLWRPGSDTAPAIPWHEIDFEMGQESADYQTQIMTPGSSPPLYRTEHPAAYLLPARPWEQYYTYRIEWTPTYIAFFVDGTEVRRETDPVEFATLFDKDSTGNTPTNERMELRTGVWPGDTNISGWSGVFDGTSVPTGHFVDYVKVWAYTPTQANQFSTLLMDDEFNTLNLSNWYPAQWTFDFSASDYVSNNIGVIDGRLVEMLTTAAGQGILQAPPADVPAPVIEPTVPNGFVIESEDYDSYSDTTVGNWGNSPTCSTTDVDAEPTIDPTGGRCYVGWTEPTEYLGYDFSVPKDNEYTVTLRIASLYTNVYLHVEVDGVDVSGPVAGPGLGWQTFAYAPIPGVFLSAGAHNLRVVFDTGGININYMTFAPVTQTTTPPTNLCLVSCDDANPCTTDTCDPLTGCKFANNTGSCADDGNTCTNDVCAAGVCTHPNNTATCADDGNTCTNDVCAAGVCTHPNNTLSCTDDGSACTSDVCSAGACTHPSNGTCTTTPPSGTATPCTGLCTNPVVFNTNNFNSGNLGSGATCYQTSVALNGGVCGNLASGRKMTVNGVAMSCTSNWPSPLPAKRNGGYCVQTTAGDYPWAYFATW